MKFVQTALVSVMCSALIGFGLSSYSGAQLRLTQPAVPIHTPAVICLDEGVSPCLSPAKPVSLKVPSKGVRLTDWYALATAHNQMQDYAPQTIVAAGTTQATATQILNPLVFVSTAAASTGVALPSCVAGSVVMVSNAGANTLAVYGKSGTSDTINATAGSTGTTQSTNTSKIYFCPAAGKWAAQ